MLNEFTAKMTQSGAIGSWLGGCGEFLVKSATRDEGNGEERDMMAYYM